MVDHCSLNQSRTEDITLKEDFRNEFLTLVDFGKKHVARLFLAFLLMPPVCAGEQEMNHRSAIRGCWT